MIIPSSVAASMNGNEGVIVVARTRDEIEGARDGWKERYGRMKRGSTSGFYIALNVLDCAFLFQIIPRRHYTRENCVKAFSRESAKGASAKNQCFH